MAGTVHYVRSRRQVLRRCCQNGNWPALNADRGHLLRGPVEATFRRSGRGDAGIKKPRPPLLAAGLFR
jgi:hypothetical protein